MSEAIETSLKRAAIALAEELDYVRAAEKLNITNSELRKQVSALETLLCLHIFKPKQKRVELTADGQFLVEAFRKAIAIHERNARNDAAETSG